MPYDLSLVTKVDKSTMTKEQLAAIGNVDYIMQMYTNDIQFDSFGLLVETTSSPKLVQSLIKIFLTSIGTHAEDSLYGTPLEEYIGGKIDGSTYTNITDGIVAAIRHYDELNVDNDSSDEYVESLETVDLSRDPGDPRKVFIKIQTTNESGQTINVAVFVGQ